MLARKCEAPVADGMRFPLKSEYDRVNGDLFDPAFHEADPSDAPKPAELWSYVSPQWKLSQADWIRLILTRNIDQSRQHWQMKTTVL